MTQVLMPTTSSGYASEMANFVEVSMQQITKYLQQSNAFGLEAKGVYRVLEEVFEECSVQGWDGEGAEPISCDTLINAKIFLESLPYGVNAPDVGAEPDGAITFEWYQSLDRLLSVSISADGFIYYALLIGQSRRHGAEPIRGDLPQDLIRYISYISIAE